VKYHQHHTCIMRSHGSVTSIVRAIPQVNGKGKLPLSTNSPLNRLSPNIAHVITSTISAHMVKIVPVVTSPHIAKLPLNFISFFVRKIFPVRPLNQFRHVTHQQTRIHAEWCLFGGQNIVFSHVHPQTEESPLSHSKFFPAGHGQKN